MQNKSNPIKINKGYLRSVVRGEICSGCLLIVPWFIFYVGKILNKHLGTWIFVLYYMFVYYTLRKFRFRDALLDKTAIRITIHNLCNIILMINPCWKKNIPCLIKITLKSSVEGLQKWTSQHVILSTSRNAH